MSDIHQEFPQCPDSEKGVLAAMLLSPIEVRSLCAEMGITSEAFYLPAHVLLFDAMVDIIDASKPLEFITLVGSLRDAGKLDAVGGPAFINELSVLLPSAAYVTHHAQDVLQKYALRRLIGISTDAVRAAHSRGAEPAELIAAVHADIGKLIHQRSTRPTVKQTLQEIVDEVREGRNDKGLLVVPVDGAHGRLRLYRGDLFIISAPTSCGKTALGAQFAFGYAKQGLRAAIYPLEMAQKQVLKRAIAQQGGDNADFVRKLALGAESPNSIRVIDGFMQTAREIAAMPLHIRDDLFKWEQIRADLRTEHAKQPFAFVLIDYLQLIQTGARHERRQLAIAEITQGAKMLAKELECVICIPSQVNKEGGTREAQDAENDASALVRIQGEEDDKGDVRPGRVSIWKQREGERHMDLPLKFNGLLTRFEPA